MRTIQQSLTLKTVIHLFILIIINCIVVAHAVDYPAQSYTAASAPGVASKSFGFDYLSGTINHQQNDISGALPYTRMYQASVRSDMAFALNYYDKMVTNAGWTDNYDNFIDYQSIGNSTTDVMYRIRLPGEMQATFFVWNSSNNTWKRMYSSNPYEKMISPTGILTKSDLGEYSLSKNGNQLTITKYGNTYITTNSPYTSGTSKYLRIAEANYPASSKKLTFGYDAALNMINVQDNRGNTLTFTRNFKENSNATSQTINEKTVITGVALTAGGTSTTQQVSYDYQAVWNKNINLDDDVVYKLTKSVSTIGGTKNFIYSQLMTPWTNWFLRTKANVNSFNDPALSMLKVPILTEIQNKNAITQSKIIVTQKYDATQSGYTSATATIRAYAPIAGTTATDMTASYNDLTGATSLTDYKPNGSTSVSASNAFSVATSQKTVEGVTYNDDSQATLTYSSPSNFSIFTVGGQPISSMVNDSYYSRLVSYKTLSGVEVSLKYDGLNRLTEKTEVVTNNSLPSRTTTYEYGPLADGSFNFYLVPTKITGPNLVVTNSVNSRGQITKQVTTSPQGGSSTRTVNYDYYEDSSQPTFGLLKVAYGLRDGQQVGDIAQFPDKTEYTYDAWGNIASTKSFVSNMHSGTTTARLTQYLDYNSAGLPGRKIDPDGKTTTYTYNSAYQLTKENYADLAVTSRTYNDLNQLTSSTDADGKTTSYSYDDLGRVIRVTKPADNYTSYQYYPNGVVKLEQQHNPDGYVFERSNQDIDGNGRVSKSWKGTDSTWLSISYGYDNNGNVTSQTDANGIVERWSYDAFNRVINHTDGNGKVDSKGYDSSDNVTTITDPNNNSALHYYKNTRTLMQDSNSELPIKQYWHDTSENVVKRLYGNRACWYNQHDQLGRIRYSECLDENNNDGNLKAKTFYGWDDLHDRLLNVVDETNGSFTNKGVDTYYDYDALGRVIKKRQLNKTPKQWGYPTTEQSVQYSYSAAGRLQTMTYPSGNRIEYGYSAAGRLQAISLNESSILCDINWDGADRIRNWAWGCQDQHRYFVDISDAGIIFGIRNRINGADQFAENYYIDKAGRINRKVIDGSYTITYGYDNNDWLKTECRGANGGTCDIAATYSYDNNGNRLSKTWSGNGTVALPPNETYGYWRNVLTNWTIGGNNSNINNTAYQELIDPRIGTPHYDFAGRRKIESGVPGSNKYIGVWNEYNHKNERTFRGGSWIDRQYVYDEHSHLIGEYKPDGSLIVEYVWLDDKPVAAIYPGNKVYWMVTDHQNVPRRLIDRDTKAQVWAWNPDAFGRWNPVGSIEMNLRFPGQYYDEQSGLFYNHNRYYNPELGRYMEPDPIALEGGLNMFAYAGSNPVNNVDPSGLSFSPNGVMDYHIPNTLLFNSIDLNFAQMSFERASSNFISAGMSPDYSNLLAAKTPKPSGIRDSLLGYAESNGKTWHQEVAEFAVSEYDRQSAVTRPTLPPKKIAEGGGVSVEHYYRSNDHPPAHAHVVGGGKTTRIGPNGKPLAGDPELTPIQRRLVDENKSRIRRNVNKIGRWLDFGD